MLTTGRIAVIVEIVDHKRVRTIDIGHELHLPSRCSYRLSNYKLTIVQVLVDGPSEDAAKAVPRHSAPLSSLALTPIVMQKLPRAIGRGPLKRKWEAAKVEQQWEESTFARSRARSEKRRQLNDFERFKVMRLKKQVRFEEKKALAKIKASA